MKKKFLTLKGITLLLSAALLTGVITQCKKVGVNADATNRSVSSSDLDSTIFAPFYDSTRLMIASGTGANDVIITTGIQTIIKNNCASAGCHGGSISPTLLTYSQIKSLVVPGSPESSQLWQMITTHDLNKAMPPVAKNADLTIDQKIPIYNWIKNGANETPSLVDYRPGAIRIITGGCTAQCHNESLTVGAWANTINNNFGRPLTQLDTTTGISFSNKAGRISINDTLTARIWGTYRDSITKFYSDTLNYASFKQKRAIGTALGPLNTYQDIIFDVNYPKGGRNYATPYNYATASYNLLTRVDSSLIFVNSYTNTSSPVNGSMAKQDGHLTPSEIALIKAWYFADPNILDQWKYGTSNQGIFKDIASGKMITKKQ
ncbi:c-type cytochrome domain-containing protein [Chitinophagaceae bacterium LWZ2-11]